MEKILGGGGGGGVSLKKCWTNCLADLKDRSIEIV